MTLVAPVANRRSFASSHDTTPLRFWWQYAWLPLAAFALLATTFATTQFDLDIARAVFFDTVNQRWIGANSLWTNEVVHTGGQWFVRSLVAAALVLWAATFRKPGLRELRRPAAYFIVAVVLSISCVGLLKTITNVHCPWALADFGGSQPYLHLFAHRPASMRIGHCFPAAHASSGYALIAFYFVFRECRPKLATIGIVVTVLVGLVFGLAQQSRGAHFVSHDVWSAFLVWIVSLSIYAFGFKTQLWSSVRQPRHAGNSAAAAGADGRITAPLQQH